VLTSLSIKNYALIDSLQVNFSEGLTIITGETGAGKSILLGGLSLVLGKRADLSVLQNHDKKCVIEAEFSIKKYALQSFFKDADLDYDDVTIVRREIAPSGKSRAFINDTPVTLDVISRLGSRLIDVHSQHQTLQLTEKEFQYQIIDAVAGNASILSSYKATLSTYIATKKQLQELINFQQEANKEQDYNSFLLQELQQAQLQPGLLIELEEEYEKLNNVEEIKEKLAHSYQLLSDEQMGIVTLLTELKVTLNQLSSYGDQFKQLFERVQSASIELDDVFDEIKSAEENTEANPQLLEEVNSKLQTIYNLQKKHNALDIEELLSIQQSLEDKVQVTQNLEANIKEKQLEVLSLEEELDKLSAAINKNRVAAIPSLKTTLESSLAPLGMPNAQFKIEVVSQENYLSNGKDELQFLFSANKGGSFGALKKVASGGELSRIMLCIKALLAQHIQLPTIMFDEIDTGVSGEVSNKMGDIMQRMSKHMQVFTITHLPQVAAKGAHHFKVFKEDDAHKTATRMKKLSQEQRVNEIAEMLGGKELSSAAIAHAKGLLATL
jgi:DNA repair protein RecN (Recombination protein N)